MHCGIRDTDIENRLVDTVGEGEGWTNWERSMETYILPYVKQIASGNLLYDAGSSAQYSMTTWNDGIEVGGSFKRAGTYVCL